MDINRYSDMKTKKTVNMLVANGMIIITQKRFDPETGVALEPQATTMTIKQAMEQSEQQIKTLENILASIKDFRADVEAAMAKNSAVPQE